MQPRTSNSAAPAARCLFLTGTNFPAASTLSIAMLCSELRFLLSTLCGEWEQCTEAHMYYDILRPYSLVSRAPMQIYVCLCKKYVKEMLYLYDFTLNTSLWLYI